jgi:quercetin dioxygenase-like cupin family protein
VLTHRTDGETITARERRDVLILAERPAITITWSRYAAGERGPDPHVHREHTDAFYVLAGELVFGVGPGGAERVSMPAGGFVAVPPNVVHTFANESTADARWLNVHAPDKGFAAYLRDARNGLDAAFDSFDPPADGGLPAAGVIVTRPGEGERVAVGLPGLSVAEWALDGRIERHDDQIALYYVLEGELEITVDGSVRAAGPETLASIPAGVPHALAGAARVLAVHAR